MANQGPTKDALTPATAVSVALMGENCKQLVLAGFGATRGRPADDSRVGLCIGAYYTCL